MKQFLLAVCFLTCSLFVYSQQDLINLPAPQKTGGMPLLETFDKRQSNRQYTGQELDQQTLSNLLWSAYGFSSRPGGKRTIATSENKQELEVYVVFKDAAYYYDATAHQLKLHAKGDFSEALGQPNVTANVALSLVYVANVDKASSREACFIDTGHICQNVYLFCTSAGLGTVARGSFKKPDLYKALKFGEKQEITLVQAVGQIK
ncbi:MAG: hypothetical protein RL662_1510 [Bacteroidota bacterium]|jgi:SagB-type dehydrogenase family enzyme